MDNREHGPVAASVVPRGGKQVKGRLLGPGLPTRAHLPKGGDSGLPSKERHGVVQASLCPWRHIRQASQLTRTSYSKHLGPDPFGRL